jgi:tetratricopeptide (TPR) repeat protein
MTARKRRIPAPLRLALVAIIALALLAAAAVKRVPPGSEALRLTRGGATTVLSPGWHLVTPGTALLRYPTGAKSFRVPSTGAVPVIFQNGDSMSVAFRFDVTIPPGSSPVIYKGFSTDFESAFARMVVAASEVSAAEQSATEPRALEAAVVSRIRDELVPLGIVQVDGRLVRWGDVSFEEDAAGEAAHKKIAAPRRLVIVGVDSGDWLNLRPLIDAGKLPNFARLVHEGATGPLRSLEPMLSPLLWTTMATGRYPEDHGVLDFTVVDANGARVPIGRHYRKVDAFWNMLSSYGQRVDVVGWLATDPAESIHGVMITDQFGYVAYAPGDTARAQASSVSPPQRRDEMTARVVHAPDVSARDIARFVHLSDTEIARHRGVFDPKDPVNNMIHLYSSTSTYRNIALHLLETDGPDVLAVYFEWVDAMSHLFMLHAPPRMPDVNQAEYNRYKDAVEQAYLLQDEILGDIMAKMDDRTVLMVISDHGFRSGSVRLKNRPEIWAGNAAKWHRIEGLVAFYGAGVRRGASIEGASILDVAPTVLALMGLPRAQDMPGKAITSAFTDEVVGSFSTEAMPTLDRPREQVAAEIPASNAAAQETMKKLEALGYLAPDDADLHNNLGQRFENRGEYRKAIEEYQKAIALRPDYHAAYNNIAVCYGKLKMYPEAQAALEKCIQLDPQNFAAMTNLAVLYLETGRVEAGVRLAERVVRTEPGFVNGRVTLGGAYAMVKRYDDAERELREALRLDPENEDAKGTLEYVERARSSQ